MKVRVVLNPIISITKPDIVGVTIPISIIIAKNILFASFLSSGKKVLLIEMMDKGYVIPWGIPRSNRATVKRTKFDGKTEINTKPSVVIDIAKDI